MAALLPAWSTLDAMTAVFVPIVAQLEACLYDGTNGAAIVAQLADSTFTSDVGGVLSMIDHQPLPQEFTADTWILRQNGRLGGALDQAAYSGFHTDLTDVVKDYAPEATLVQSTGSASVPASLLGQTADYDITMSPALPNTSFVPIAQLRGAPNIVSGHGIIAVSVLDVDTVRVQITSGAASLAGASVRVTAFALTY